MSNKAHNETPPVWSWVDEIHVTTGTPGNHRRPWSVRERLVTEEIGKEVKRLREAKGWSNERLARRLCCSAANISHIENGSRSLWMPLLWDLADVFDVCPTHFIKVADAAIARLEQGGRRRLRAS